MLLSILLLVLALTGAHISGGMYGSYYQEQLNTPEGDRAEQWFVANAVVFLLAALAVGIWLFVRLVRWSLA